MNSIYIDEDVDVLIKTLLKAKGFRVFTTLDEGMLGKSDIVQLDHAIELNSIFLSHNRVHVEELYANMVEEGKEHYGIIIATRRNVYELARMVSRFLELHNAESIRNQLWYI